MAYQRGKVEIAVGFDEGSVVVKMGREEPAVSMDSSGKLIWARHNDIVSAIIKGGGGLAHTLKHCSGADRVRSIYQGQLPNPSHYEGLGHLRGISGRAHTFPQRPFRGKYVYPSPCNLPEAMHKVPMLMHRSSRGW